MKKKVEVVSCGGVIFQLSIQAEAEDTKKRLQEYTEELYKKDLNDPDSHDGVITHLEPDILQCEVKWALGSFTMTKLVEVTELQLSYSNPNR